MLKYILCSLSAIFLMVTSANAKVFVVEKAVILDDEFLNSLDNDQREYLEGELSNSNSEGTISVDEWEDVDLDSIEAVTTSGGAQKTTQPEERLK